jgi:penicillin amidase
MRKRLLKISAILLGIVAVVIIGLCLWIRGEIMGSLAQLDGERPVKGIAADVKVERDNLGIPTIRAANRKDLAYATGFVHAQDRFFQMDLLRRNSAGELAEIAGPDVAAADKKVRVHRFRDVARRVVDKSSGQEREVLLAYADGVNAGLAALASKPFEYLLLGATPAPWKPEDCVLVMFSMYLDLQGTDFENEARLGLMHDLLPGPMFEFLAPRGTEWDAPVQGQAFAAAPIPGPEVFDTRKQNLVALADLSPTDRFSDAGIGHPGSNNWALSAKHTTDGRAFVANDMHLGIRVPHIWYRASFVWHDSPQDKQDKRMTGVSLPGTPVMVVGSNGHVAWGFTNSQGDWVDVVLIDVDPHDNDSYLTPKGSKKFDHHEEIVKVKGAPDVVLDVVSTIWGPIFDHDYKGRPRAIRWVANDTDGVNMGLMHIESAPTLEEAMRLANLTGAPAQNFVVADDKGRIAWTIMGRIPRRVGFDGRLPTSWADGKHRWDGYLKPEEYPRIVDPAEGRIWTANARVVSGDDLAKMGDGFYDLGARAQQIRDDLKAIDKAKETDMLKIQLDDRAVFLTRWQKLLVDTLTPEAIKADPRRGELKKLVDNWGGHASIDSVGFRAVRSFRLHLLAELSDVLVSPCKKVVPNFSIAGLDRTEGPIWRLVSERPAHLIDPRYKDWNALLLAAADDVIARANKDGRQISGFTWGQFNTTRILHPLSAAVPALSGWLDMPAHELAGDWDNMPRIQAPAMGASERMTVSPGHEADGYLHMPCGQSGHPFSPHYADAHAAWEEGKPTPFLPGATVHTLVLKPAA